MGSAWRELPAVLLEGGMLGFGLRFIYDGCSALCSAKPRVPELARRFELARARLLGAEGAAKEVEAWLATPERIRHSGVISLCGGLFMVAVAVGGLVEVIRGLIGH